MTVTVCGVSYSCATALKGSDYVRLLDSAGDCVAAFDGITDFNAFAISGGSWTTPKSSAACNLAVVHEDGSVSGCGKPMSQFLTANTPFAGVMVLSNGVQYGTSLPSTGVAGQIFFKIS